MDPKINYLKIKAEEKKNQGTLLLWVYFWENLAIFRKPDGNVSAPSARQGLRAQVGVLEEVRNQEKLRGASDAIRT